MALPWTVSLSSQIGKLSQSLSVTERLKVSVGVDDLKEVKVDIMGNERDNVVSDVDVLLPVGTGTATA